jgi:hypothetical protein
MIPTACEVCHATTERKPSGATGKIELRPYGPGGKWICHACGKKDPKQTEKQMGKAMRGNTLLTKHGPIPLITRRRR